MSVFSLNKISAESKLLHILQDKFFITARRNKILAKWAGGRLGYKDDKLAKYIRKVVFSYILLPNDRKLVDRIENDFAQQEIDVKREEIINKMKTAEERAKKRRKLSND